MENSIWVTLMKKLKVLILTSVIALNSCTHHSLINTATLMESYSVLSVNYDSVLLSLKELCDSLEKEKCGELTAYLEVIDATKESFFAMHKPNDTLSVVLAINKIQTNYDHAKFAWIGIRDLILNDSDIDRSKLMALAYYDEVGRDFDQALTAMLNSDNKEQKYEEITNLVLKLMNVAVKTAALL